MTVSRVNNTLFTALSALNGRTLSTLTAINGQTILAGGGALDLFRSARRFCFKPQGAVSLNYGHPLAAGIINCFLVNEGGGLIIHDIANPSYVGTLGGSPTLSWTTSTGGLGLTTVGGTGTHITIPALDAPYLGDLTMVWYGSFRVGSVFHSMFTKTATNGATNSPLEFRTTNNNPPRLQILAADASNLNVWTTTTSISLGFDHQLVAVRPALLTSTPTFYVDGVPTATPTLSGSATTATGTNANIELGRRPDGGSSLDGGLTMMFIYGRLLSATEVQALYINPFQILMPARFH